MRVYYVSARVDIQHVCGCTCARVCACGCVRACWHGRTHDEHMCLQLAMHPSNTCRTVSHACSHRTHHEYVFRKVKQRIAVHVAMFVRRSPAELHAGPPAPTTVTRLTSRSMSRPVGRHPALRNRRPLHVFTSSTTAVLDSHSASRVSNRQPVLCLDAGGRLCLSNGNTNIVRHAGSARWR